MSHNNFEAKVCGAWHCAARAAYLARLILTTDRAAHESRLASVFPKELLEKEGERTRKNKEEERSSLRWHAYERLSLGLCLTEAAPRSEAAAHV